MTISREDNDANSRNILDVYLEEADELLDRWDLVQA